MLGEEFKKEINELINDEYYFQENKIDLSILNDLINTYNKEATFIDKNGKFIEDFLVYNYDIVQYFKINYKLNDIAFKSYSNIAYRLFIEHIL